MSAERLELQHVDWRDLDGDVIVFHRRHGTCLSLNMSAAVLWRRLADGATRQELVATLTTVFEVSDARATAAIELFLSNLMAQDVLATDVELSRTQRA